MWAYKLFRIGALALVVTGGIHLLGYFAGHSAKPSNGTEFQLRDLLYGYKFNLMGTMRGMGEVHDGLSLAFTASCWALAALGFTMPVEKKLAIVMAASLAVLTLISVTHWFFAPTACLSICLAFYAGSALLNR